MILNIQFSKCLENIYKLPSIGGTGRFCVYFLVFSDSFVNHHSGHLDFERYQVTGTRRLGTSLYALWTEYSGSQNVVSPRAEMQLQKEVFSL